MNGKQYQKGSDVFRKQLRQVPCIKSCEADQLLELTDPVESESSGDLVRPATALDAPNRTVFKSRLIDGSQEQVEAQKDIEADGLTSYGDSTASSGEILPYGVKGPAFLVMHNYHVLKIWNASTDESIETGILADRYAKDFK